MLTQAHTLPQTRQDSLLLDFLEVSGGDQARDAAVVTSWVGHEKGEGATARERERVCVVVCV